MQWIRTGRQLGKAVRNVGRLRQILSVFAKHGFADLILRMNLGPYVPRALIAKASDPIIENTPERLRRAFEELGPTFVKLGQLLSTRPDILNQDYLAEMVRLQDNVAPIPFAEIKKVVEAEFKRPLSEMFANFSETPLASASISQVHEATVNGQDVVVKIQRPNIASIILTDISLVSFIAGMLERYVPEVRLFRPKTVVDEFFHTLILELDFLVEANNITRMGENLKSIEEIRVPKIFKDHSSKRVLTMERFTGIRLNNIKELRAANVDLKRIVDVGARAFFKTVMIDGLFHGDLHGGNLFVLPDQKLGIIDFGIVGRLSRKARDQLATMVMSLVQEDFENLCYLYAELGAADSSVDFEGFQREVQNSLAPYMGLSLKDVNAGKVLIESTRIATKYRIGVPGEWMLVFKAIVTIEGMGRTLDPDFDLIQSGQHLVKDILKDQYTVQKITRDFAWVGRDLLTLLQVLPRQIRWMFKKFNRDDFAFEIKTPSIDRVGKIMDRNGKRYSIAMITSALLIASSLSLGYKDFLTYYNLPALSALYLLIAVILLLRLSTL